MKTFVQKLVMCALFIIWYNFNIITSAQIPKLQDPTNSFIVNHAACLDPDGGVIYFINNSVAPYQLFSQYREFTGLGNDDVMDTIRSWDDTDSLSLLHHFLYQQYYKGLLVEGAEYTEHHNGSYVIASSGFIAENLNLSATPSISESNALEYALTHINGSYYPWQDETLEDPSQFYPQGTLLFTLIDGANGIRAENYVLAWKFDVRATIGSSDTAQQYHKDIYINATNGEIIKEITKICAGDFDHIYYGWKGDLDDRWDHQYWWYNYYVATAGWRNMMTTDIITNPNFQGAGYYSHDADWQWTNMPENSTSQWGSSHWSATSSHYCAQKAYDYYHAVFSRNGVSGWGNLLRIVSDYGSKYAAFYDHSGAWDYIVVSRKNNNLASTYDIIGHEFTHGVDEYSKKLTYLPETGAIKEGFGDIFGFMVERFAIGYVKDWTIGEDCGTIFRNMQNPTSVSVAPESGCNYPTTFPAYYKGPNWYYGTCDDYGSHLNMSVLNKWFYFLSMGGSQIVNGSTRYATAIGPDKAARIAYYTLTNNVTNTESYPSLRAHSLLAAALLYGLYSQEYNATCQAWYAVNVGVCENVCIATQWWKYSTIYQKKSTGINNVENSDNLKIKVFPNPANKNITLSIEDITSSSYDKQCKIIILDINGREVYNGEHNKDNSIMITTTELSSGIYIVKISSGNWQKALRFIKL